MNVSFDEAVKRGWVCASEVPKVKGNARKSELEGTEQAELLKEFRLRFPELGPLLIHIPNGGSRKNAYEGWRLKEQGVRAGVSDLFLPVGRKGFHGLWIEFKAAPPNDAVISVAQKEWVTLMQGQGYHAEVCKGAQAAMVVLTAYLS